MTKTILVPTDFSPNAHTALQYAIGLAIKQQYTIQLVHIFQAFTTRFGDKEFNRDISDHAESTAMQQLEQLRKQIQSEYPGIEIAIECLEGDEPSVVLAQIAGRAQNQLIVMGTKGASNLRDRLMGSNTYQTVSSSPIPVLAIPEGFDRFQADRAGLLSNFKKTEIELLTTFTDIFGKDTEITLLHVREQLASDDPDASRLERELETWTQHLKTQTGTENMDWKMDSTMSRLDVPETLPDCIHDMAEDRDLQILLVSYNTKSFFRRLFSRNLVKNMAHQLHRPVFFFKEKP